MIYIVVLFINSHNVYRSWYAWCQAVNTFKQWSGSHLEHLGVQCHALRPGFEPGSFRLLDDLLSPTATTAANLYIHCSPKSPTMLCTHNLKSTGAKMGQSDSLTNVAASSLVLEFIVRLLYIFIQGDNTYFSKLLVIYHWLWCLRTSWCIVPFF